MKHEKSRSRAATIFRRIQDLVVMLQKSRSSNFWVLNYLNTFEDSEKSRFEIVHRFLDKHFTSLRLHYLLKEENFKELRSSHIEQKIILIKIMTACLQNVHLFDWVHKNLSSYNILFFTSTN